MRRTIGCLGVLVCVLLVGGCFDRLELNELAVANMMGLDLTEDGRIRVSLQLVVPSVLTNPGGESGVGGLDAAFYVVDAVASSISEALQKIQSKVSRRLFTSHIRVVIIGERLARAGIAPILDGLLRLREMRITMDVVVVQGEAFDLLRVNPRFSRLPATALSTLLFQRVVPARTVREVAIALMQRGKDPFVPWIGIAQRTQAFDADQSSGQEFELLGAGIFQADRLVGFVSLSDAAGLSWLVGEVPQFVEPVEWPAQSPHVQEEDKDRDQHPLEGAIDGDAPPGSGPDATGSEMRDVAQIVAIVRQGAIRFRTEEREGKVVVAVDVRVNEDIQLNQAGLDLTDPSLIPPLEDLLARALEAQMRSMLHKAQEEFQADVFGFGELIHRNHPELWRKLKDAWHVYFPELEVEISVEVIVRRTGLTNAPAGFHDDQLRK